MLKPYFLSWTLSVFLTLPAASVCGQDFPSKPIRIVTVAAGGSGDFASRLIAQEISGPLGQPVIVDNRANTVLAIEAMELIALARARPGELNYSSAPAGGSSHLSAELFKAMGKVNLVWVPYKGAAPAILGLIGGEAHLSFGGGGAVAPHLKSGKLRALAVTGLRSSTLVPGLPTVAEAGVPGFEVVAIDVLLAPAKTPAAIVNRLNQEVVRALNRPDTKEKLLNVGVEVATSSPEELTALIKTEMAKWGKLIKDINLRLE